MSKTLRLTGNGENWANMINDAYVNGFRTFVCGDTEDFGAEAAYDVLQAMDVCSDIKLIMHVPHRNLPNEWSPQQHRDYDIIMAQADDVVYL